ncbi:MAG: hypothetical protein QUS14_07115 [Pyrinomonadaceae bacterium]|nr:hypothetical protein [Pyrinomonadaceae bacterium]
MKRPLLTIAALVLFAAGAFAQGNSYQTVNIIEDFWRFWETSQSADEATRVKNFREMVIAPHADIFAGFTGQRSDEDLAKYLKQIEKLIPRMRSVNARLGSELPLHEAKFLKALPDMKWKGKVVFMPNYGITDSGTGRMDDVDYLIFGVDTIAAKYGENADLAALFHHELFHMYHSQTVAAFKGKSRENGEVPLYWLVWGEGLATYVSHRLNPDATLEQILLNKTLAEQTNAAMPRFAKEIRENIDSGDPNIWKPFMSAGANDKGIPPRSGYYIGYLIASELGKKTSLQKLARLSGEELKKKMVKALAKLEKQGTIAK